MKLQARLLLVYTALFVGAVGFLVFQRALDISRSRTVLQSELRSRHTYLNKIMSLEGGDMLSFSTDYSFWDDMVNFVHHPTKDWAAQNIDTGESTFGADAAWVYDTNDKLVYYSSPSGDNSASNISLPNAAFTQLRKNPAEHYYVKEPNGIMEIWAATIVPTSDQNHSTPAQGFWLVGRYINSAYLQKLSDLSQSTVTLQSASASTADHTSSKTVSFGVPMPGWDGTKVGVLKLVANVPVETDLENLYNRELLLLLLFFVASAILVVGSLWVLVLRPVKTISRAIQQQVPEILGHIATVGTEFGDLAKVVQLSFTQKLKIDESEFLKQKLEELNKAKSEFLAIAAHELRGPVGNINIFAGDLAETLDEKTIPTDELKEELGRISQQAHKANVLINDMYQASKGGRTLDFNKKEIDFDQFMKSEVENAQYSINQRIISQGQTGQKIMSDPDRLSQVMSNLIRNASKYSSNDKEIIVRTSYENNAVKVEVQDFGLGIDPTDQPNLFQRFYRSSRVAKEYPGLGLGLSVCKEIIDGLGGHIWLTSQLGQGSHFFFSLPVAGADAPAPAPTTQNLPPVPPSN